MYVCYGEICFIIFALILQEYAMYDVVEKAMLNRIRSESLFVRNDLSLYMDVFLFPISIIFSNFHPKQWPTGGKK